MIQQPWKCKPISITALTTIFAAPLAPPKNLAFRRCSSFLFFWSCFCVFRRSIFEGTWFFGLWTFSFSTLPRIVRIVLKWLVRTFQGSFESRFWFMAVTTFERLIWLSWRAVMIWIMVWWPRFSHTQTVSAVSRLRISFCLFTVSFSFQFRRGSTKISVPQFWALIFIKSALLCKFTTVKIFVDP